jgi:hypothetical protein
MQGDLFGHGDATLKTGSLFGPLPDNHVRIGISRGVPRRMPAGFRRYPRLNPGPWFNSVDADEYDRLYAAEVLARLDPHRVRDELLRLADGRVPVLCCFERGPPATCHRALVAEWFEKAGITCRELGHEERAEHPLMMPLARLR